MLKKSFLNSWSYWFYWSILFKKNKKEKKQIFLISRKIKKKTKLKNEFEYDVFNNFVGSNILKII